MKRVLVAVAGCCLIASVASAQDTSPAQGATASSSAALSLANRVLKKSYINSDSGLVAVGAGFQAVDGPTNVNCPGTSGVCVIEADQHLQVISGVSGNRWAICTAVDGNFMADPLCPFLGIATTSNFEARSFTQTQHGVSFGNHTVQTFVYSDAGLSRSIYEITYRVYKP
jgi:hypothetical protein